MYGQHNKLTSGSHPVSGTVSPPRKMNRSDKKASETTQKSFFGNVDDIFSTLFSLTLPPSDSPEKIPVRILYTFSSHGDKDRVVTVPPSGSVLVQKLGEEQALPKSDMIFKYRSLFDFVAVCNKEQDPSDLVSAGKLKVNGNRKHLKLDAVLMDMARARTRRGAGTSMPGPKTPTLTPSLRSHLNATRLRASAVSKLRASSVSFPSHIRTSTKQLEEKRSASGVLLTRRKSCEEKEDISRAKAQELATLLELSDVRDTDLNKVANVKTKGKEYTRSPSFNVMGAKEVQRRYKESKKQQTKRLTEDPLLTPSQVRERQKIYDQQRRKGELKRKSQKMGAGFLIGMGAGMGLTTLAQSAEREMHLEQGEAVQKGQHHVASPSSPRSVATSDSLDKFLPPLLNGGKANGSSQNANDSVPSSMVLDSTVQTSPTSSLTLSDGDRVSSPIITPSLLNVDDGKAETTAALVPVSVLCTPPESSAHVTRLSTARMRKRALEEQRAAMRNSTTRPQKVPNETGATTHPIAQSNSLKVLRTEPDAALHNKGSNVVGPELMPSTDKDGTPLSSAGPFAKMTPCERWEIAKPRSARRLLETETAAAHQEDAVFGLNKDGSQVFSARHAPRSYNQDGQKHPSNSQGRTKGYKTGRSLVSSSISHARYHSGGGRLQCMTSASFTNREERKKLMLHTSSSGKLHSRHTSLPALC